MTSLRRSYYQYSINSVGRLGRDDAVMAGAVLQGALGATSLSFHDLKDVRKRWGLHFKRSQFMSHRRKQLKHTPCGSENVFFSQMFLFWKKFIQFMNIRQYFRYIFLPC